MSKSQHSAAATEVELKDLAATTAKKTDPKEKKENESSESGIESEKPSTSSRDTNQDDIPSQSINSHESVELLVAAAESPQSGSGSGSDDDRQPQGRNVLSNAVATSSTAASPSPNLSAGGNGNRSDDLPQCAKIAFGVLGVVAVLMIWCALCFVICHTAAPQETSTQNPPLTTTPNVDIAIVEKIVRDYLKKRYRNL